MPAEVLVGARVLVKICSQAAPPPPEPQAAPAADKRPLASVCTHLVPVPMSVARETFPLTPSTKSAELPVVNAAVLVPTLKYPATEVVASSAVLVSTRNALLLLCTTLKSSLTRSVELNVELASTKMPAEVLVGVRAADTGALCCQGERLTPEAVSTLSAPEVMTSPAPVISVIAASPPTCRESTTVVVALSVFTRRVVIVDEAAFTRMPAAVFVGASTLVETNCQAPFTPAAPQAEPVADKSPAEEACTQDVMEEARLSRVTAPEVNRVPLNLEAPSTAKEEDGALVPTPTLPEVPSTNKLRILLPVVNAAVLVPTLKYPATEVVASSAVLVSTRNALLLLCTTLKSSLTRSVELNVELASTKMPAEVLVGVRAADTVALCCQGERLIPEAVSTLSAPEVMTSPAPVISVIAASPPTCRESTTVVVALRVLTLSVVMVEEAALTKIPVAVLVGWSTFVATACQAPAEPAAAQPKPVTERSPAEEACTQDVAEEARLSSVTAPEANRLPINREAPTTPSVVEGAEVLMPTCPSAPSAQNTGVARESVDEATRKNSTNVVVASSAVVEVSTSRALVFLCTTLKSLLTLSVELNVELASTKMPAEVLVGVRAADTVALCCQGERLIPEAVSTLSAPEVMTSPAPVISVIAASPPTCRESTTVVVALRVLTLSVVMVEEAALTKIPVAVLVGWSTFVATACQAPAEPAAAQPKPVTERSPAEEACAQDVAEEERISSVK